MSDDIEPEVSPLTDSRSDHTDLPVDGPVSGSHLYPGYSLYYTGTAEPQTFPASLISFDGYQFANISGMEHWLYIAGQARRGDRLAIELLTALRTSVVDHFGRSYWPPPPPTPKENDDA